VTSQCTAFYVEPGSQSASFLLQWTEPNAIAQLTVRAPDGTVYETQPMSQGGFLRVDDPMPGDWMDERPSPVCVGDQDDDKTARLLRSILLLLVVIAVALWFCGFGRRGPQARMS
jgi:hypothetical protein